jgi:hypothetical protein
MSLDQEFLAALHAGDDYDSLLELVRQYLAKGMAWRAIYDTLHRIWLDFGFDAKEDGGALQDNLEAVMERVWFGCPAK